MKRRMRKKMEKSNKMSERREAKWEQREKKRNEITKITVTQCSAIMSNYLPSSLGG